MKVYFIFGPSKYDVKKFSKYYVPLIKKGIEEGANFLIGDCDGVDLLAQHYLLNTLDEKDLNRVKIFSKGLPKNYLSEGFTNVSGFISHEEAAVAMTLCSTDDIGFVDEGYWNTLTAKNILRRNTPDYNYEIWAKSLKRHVEFWDLIFKDNG